MREYLYHDYLSSIPSATTQFTATTGTGVRTVTATESRQQRRNSAGSASVSSSTRTVRPLQFSRPQTSHSSSIGLQSKPEAAGVANVNRWSASTVSSSSRERSTSGSTSHSTYSKDQSLTSASSDTSPRCSQPSYRSQPTATSPRRGQQPLYNTHSAQQQYQQQTTKQQQQHPVLRSHRRSSITKATMETTTKVDRRTSDSTETDSTVDPSRRRARKDKDKKGLLSRALQKANDAVVHDTNQDYVAAIQAYEEACSLLSSVMSRSSNEDDRNKLTAIRETYVTRIQEIHQMNEAYSASATEDEAHEELIETTDDPPVHNMLADSLRVSRSDDIYHHNDVDIVTATVKPQPVQVITTPIQPIRIPPPTPTNTTNNLLSSTIGANGFSLADRSRVPPPLPPPPKDLPSLPLHQRPLQLQSHHLSQPPSSLDAQQQQQQQLQPQPQPQQQAQQLERSNSMMPPPLFTLSKAEMSPRSEARDSMVASNELRSKYLAQFDNPEPDSRSRLGIQRRESQIRFSFPASPAIETLQDLKRSSLDYSMDDSDEEERLLDQVPDDYFERQEQLQREQRQSRALGMQTRDSKHTIPRQSGSSGFSTHPSSGSSFTTGTAATSLSTVDENPLPLLKSQSSLSLSSNPPPALPPAPPPGLHERSSSSSIIKQTISVGPSLALPPPPSPSVQDRRSSGSAKKSKLKIETTVRRDPSPLANTRNVAQAAVVEAPPEKVVPVTVTSVEEPAEDWTRPPAPSPYLGMTIHSDPSSGVTPSTSGLTPFDSISLRPSPQSISPNSPFQRAIQSQSLRKNASTLSLKQSRHYLEEPSPGTPMSIAFGPSLPLPGGLAPLNTPANEYFPRRPATATGAGAVANGKLKLFDGNIKAMTSDDTANPPKPLEPCPESTMLRPFWLLRCIHQTLAHPKGGYLSSKFFVPRDIWKVNNAKLKNVEDKISNCDLISAALRKLGTVDTFDSSAVLDEMQQFESILDTAQLGLTKKLGNDVGVSNVSSLFKDAPVTSPGASTHADSNERGGSTSYAESSSRSSSKTFVSSWRKLRSKNSSTNLTNPSSYAHAREPQSDTHTMSSVPMTASPAVPRSIRRLDAAEVQPDGPNAAYMLSLMRLCEASQVLDQIARQVEDPGLKASSPQYVGLELSTRHAAEFYAFYVCRFVLQDVTLLMDKFIKKASEWVVS